MLLPFSTHNNRHKSRSVLSLLVFVLPVGQPCDRLLPPLFRGQSGVRDGVVGDVVARPEVRRLDPAAPPHRRDEAEHHEHEQGDERDARGVLGWPDDRADEHHEREQRHRLEGEQEHAPREFDRPAHHVGVSASGHIGLVARGRWMPSLEPDARKPARSDSLAMRQFVVLGHRAPTDPDFSLDDLAGGAGRLDVLCRCVSSALFLSHGIRDDVEVFLVLGDEVTVRIDSRDLRYMSPDERNVAGLLKQALEAKNRAIGHREAESTPGIHVSKRGFAAVLDGLDGTVVELHEDGDPLADVAPPENPVFVLSDHEDFTEEEAVRLADRSDQRVRVGPEVLHADHAITVAHNYLDTDGFTDY